MATLLVTGLALAALTAGGDTTVALRQGDRVVIELAAGDLVVRAWERSELSVTAEDDPATVGVSRSGPNVRVTAEDRRGRRLRRDVTVMVPSWADVGVRGRALDVTVTGVAGDLTVSTVEGEVSVSEAGGAVSVRTVEGEITIRHVRGSVVARSEGDDVRVEDVEGSVDVASGSGDLALIDVRGASVRAETLDGDLVFDGVLRPDGTYGFYVHDGDVVLRLPRDVGARVSVSTFDGEFASEFPVRVERFSGGRSFEFDLGDASARLEVEVFDGEIRLAVRDGRAPGLNREEKR